MSIDALIIDDDESIRWVLEKALTKNAIRGLFALNIHLGTGTMRTSSFTIFCVVLSTAVLHNTLNIRGLYFF